MPTEENYTYPYTETPTDEQKDNLLVWIAALRSGKYRQASGCLNKTSVVNCLEFDYCCLGVAGRIMESTMPGHAGTLGDEFEIYFGFDKRFQDSLVIMNDSDDLSFNEIADFLEKVHNEKGDLSHIYNTLACYTNEKDHP
jgi:hypothetical protein